MVILLFPIVFAIVVYFTWRGRAVRECRWRADSSRDKGSLRMYHCVSCGAEAYTATNGPPETCKKGVGGKGL